MVRQFKTGGVHECEVGIKDEEIGASFLIKVVGLDRTRKTLPWGSLQCRIFGKSKRSLDEPVGGWRTSAWRTAAIEAPPFSDYDDIGTFFGRSSDYDLDAEMVSLHFPLANVNYGIIPSKRAILKTGVLLFCATKLIVLAHRAKERMYAPGGIGFIAAQESFYRAAKSQRIEY